jgi:hypothetical protein
MFMTIDSSLGKPLLEPLLRLQSSSLYANTYAAADLGNYIICVFCGYVADDALRLGSKYPNVSLTNLPHEEGVERTSASLSHAWVELILLDRNGQYAHHVLRSSAPEWRRFPGRAIRASSSHSIILYLSSFVPQYYLLRGWADYLVSNSMLITNQYVPFGDVRSSH